MQVINLKNFEKNKDSYKNLILKGAVFIYPTDTIYGLGCDATNPVSVEILRKLKERDSKPFSVIAPSKSWINKNLIINESYKEYIDKLPGRYTFILNKNIGCDIAEGVSYSQSVGIRMPDNFINSFAEFCNRPIITTSVNISGKDYLTDPKQVSVGDYKNFASVDFIIDAGFLDNKPSTVIDLTGETPIILRK